MQRQKAEQAVCCWAGTASNCKGQEMAPSEYMGSRIPQLNHAASSHKQQRKVQHHKGPESCRMLGADSAHLQSAWGAG